VTPRYPWDVLATANAYWATIVRATDYYVEAVDLMFRAQTMEVDGTGRTTGFKRGLRKHERVSATTRLDAALVLCDVLDTTLDMWAADSPIRARAAALVSATNAAIATLKDMP
jgi:hypothetical protein